METNKFIVIACVLLLLLLGVTIFMLGIGSKFAKEYNSMESFEGCYEKCLDIPMLFANLNLEKSCFEGCEYKIYLEKELGNE